MIGTFGTNLNILISSAKAEALLQGPGFDLSDHYASKRAGRKSYAIASVYQPWDLESARSPPLFMGTTEEVDIELLFSTAKDEVSRQGS
ncbi:hypothetical protein H109_07192 [Trichophyton interdigitale MR816]|uniref:Uncharacterized protein n=1 Tax=Trichophyton interdigitale (strain MR816) TaxID=1215338 RepID=A0A059J030_TRIIM|nr:hypothetical protein H109_07192 [Trichophyton interdigitale MR816]